MQDVIPSVQKAIRVLNAIAGTSSNYSIGELSKSLGIPQTTVFRIIRTYMAADWVRPRVSGVGYCLSYGIAPLLEPFMNHRMLIDVIRGPMTDLNEKTKLGIKLSVRDGNDALTIFRLESKGTMGVSARVGAKFPLVLGSSGAALMSNLSESEIDAIIQKANPDAWRHQKTTDVLKRINECRKSGVCRDSGQYLPQIHTLSAAVKGPDNSVLAVITLLGMPGDFDSAKNQMHKKNLLAVIQQCQLLFDHSAP